MDGQQLFEMYKQAFKDAFNTEVELEPADIPAWELLAGRIDDMHMEYEE